MRSDRLILKGEKYELAYCKLLSFFDLRRPYRAKICVCLLPRVPLCCTLGFTIEPLQCVGEAQNPSYKAITAN